MISKQHLKFIKSLQKKKFRDQTANFLVEGEKSVVELLHSGIKINTLIATKRFLTDHIEQIRIREIPYEEVDVRTLKAAGSLQHNEGAVAVCSYPEKPVLKPAVHPVLPVFEFLQDPGNLGSILRICDWYGIGAVILSPDSVDVYNPKVIQASMGSFLRVQVYYQDLQEILSWPSACIGTSPSGKSLYDFSWPRNPMIFFGNESRGLSDELSTHMDHTISIPRYGKAESLNVAMSTAVILNHFRQHTS